MGEGVGSEAFDATHECKSFCCFLTVVNVYSMMRGRGVKLPRAEIELELTLI